MVEGGDCRVFVLQIAMKVDRVAKANQESEAKVGDTRPQELADAAFGT